MSVEQLTLPMSRATMHVRERLLTALHLARLLPGQRVPSVRRMAQMTGLDRKTVHRAYSQLVHEGLLVARAGSGTFVAPDPQTDAEMPAPDSLLLAAGRCFDEAARLGIQPAVFARFLRSFAAHRRPHVQVIVTECNNEQLGLIAHDLRTNMGVTVRPTLLQDLAEAPPSWFATSHGVVTTDCHRDEVARRLGRPDLPVYRIGLDPSHAETLLRHARFGPVLMVVRDLRYEPAWRRLLAQLNVPRELDARFRVTEPHGAERALREMDGPGGVYVSPLVGRDLRWALPPGWRRIPPQPYTDAASLDVLRAQLALADAESHGRPLTSASLALQGRSG